MNNSKKNPPQKFLGTEVQKRKKISPIKIQPSSKTQSQKTRDKNASFSAVVNNKTKTTFLHDTLSNIPRDPEYLNAPEPASAAEVVEQLLCRLKLDEHIHNRAIREIWPRLVGEHLACKSYPDSLRRGLLTVRIADSATHHHLRTLKQELLAALHRQLGEQLKITDIRFQH